MHKETATLLSKTHPLFKAGVPHFREREILVIPTRAHLVVYDVERRSPLYTMLTLSPDDDKAVDRADYFAADYTVPDDLCSTEKDYAEYNAANPWKLYDKGHSAGSQYRRATAVEQIDIDTLIGVCPETPACNRLVKGSLETAILTRSKEWAEVILVQGPLWYRNKPRGRLGSGQWIPDAVWITSLWRRKRSLEVWSWVMNNSHDLDGVSLRAVSVNELETLTGLVFWDQVRKSSFVGQRDRVGKDDWWNPK